MANQSQCQSANDSQHGRCLQLLVEETRGSWQRRRDQPPTPRYSSSVFKSRPNGRMVTLVPSHNLSGTEIFRGRNRATWDISGLKFGGHAFAGNEMVGRG